MPEFGQNLQLLRLSRGQSLMEAGVLFCCCLFSWQDKPDSWANTTRPVTFLAAGRVR
jgi:hypothetical protein